MAVDRYHQGTQRFWADVHGAWTDLYRRNAAIVLNPAGAQDLASRLSNYADQLVIKALRAAVVPAASVRK